MRCPQFHVFGDVVCCPAFARLLTIAIGVILSAPRCLTAAFGSSRSRLAGHPAAGPRVQP
eukprot:3225968-Lingulodinium_polyedra.AAC.1